MKHLSLILFCCLAVFSDMAASPWNGRNSSSQLEVFADKRKIGRNESLNLTITAHENVSGTPDFSPLEEDFRIVRKSSSHSYHSINGQATALTEWHLTLLPKKMGTAKIPPISIGSMHSKALDIEVLKENISEDDTQEMKKLFYEVSIDPVEAYVQSEVIYTVKTFVGAKIFSNGSMSHAPDIKDALVRLIEEKQDREEKDGKVYRVLIQKYAVFPQQSGVYHIPGPLFEGTVEIEGNPRRGFNGFFQMDLLPRGENIVVKGDDVTLTVRSAPASTSGVWLPARNLELREKWRVDAQPSVGEPLTREVIVKAKGLTSEQLPKFPGENSGDVKIYVEQPKESNEVKWGSLQGERKDIITYIPTKEGELVIPKYEVRWWNTETKQFAVATLPEKRFFIEKDAGHQEKEINEEIAEAPMLKDGDESALLPNDTLWKKLAAAFFALWAATVAVWWKGAAIKNIINKRNRRDRETAKSGSKDAVKHVFIASSENNGKAARDALLLWANRQFEDKPQTLERLAELVEDHSLAKACLDLERHLYRPGSGVWLGEGLQAAFSSYLKKSKKTKFERDGDLLPPLNP